MTSAPKPLASPTNFAAARAVFDEVDANVGGEMGKAIGSKLAEVARHHQVICITHLPQIAEFQKPEVYGHRLTNQEKDLSRLNLAPAVSPDGDLLGATDAAEPFLTVEVDLELARAAKATYPRYVFD